MATEVGAIKYTLDLDKKGFDQGLAESSKNAHSHADSIVGATQKIAMGFAVVSAALIGEGILAVKAYETQENATARLQQNIMNVKSATDKHIDSLTRQASALQLVTRFSDEEIISGQGMLATFQLNQGTIEQLTPSMLDMVEAMRNTGDTTMDTEQAAKLMGKAMGSASDNIDGLATALRKNGVIMTEAQKAVFKTGTEAERTATLVAIMNQNFGGAAVAAGKTFAGQMDIMNNQLGEIQETIGKTIVEALRPFVMNLTLMAQKANEWLQQHPGVLKAIVGLGVAFIGLTVILGALAVVMTVVSTVGWPVILIGIALAAVVGGLYFGIKLVVDKMGGWNEVMKKLQPAINWFKQVWHEIQKVWNDYFLPALKEIWRVLEKELIPTLTKFWQENKSWLIPALQALAIVLLVVVGIIVGVFIAALYIIVKVVTWVAEFITWFVGEWKRQWHVAQDGITTTIDFIKALINGFIDFFTHFPERMGELLGRAMRFFYDVHTVHIPNFVKGVINWIVSLHNQAVNWVSSLVNNIINWFNRLPGMAQNIGSSVYNGIIGWFQALPGTIVNIFNNIVNFVSGLPGRMWGIAQNIGNSFWQGFKRGLGISSPSFIERAFMAIGKQSEITMKDMKSNLEIMDRLSIGKSAPMLAMAANASNTNTTFNAPINIGNDADANGFLARLSRNQELAEQGLSTRGVRA
ncbi:hypothetical protein [Polynucleobacter sp.]|uniref:hypothetical protein n=1 Tax=Polynucleobacter sp. TaxID=2029855 RepID=UPI003F6A1B54